MSRATAATATLLLLAASAAMAKEYCGDYLAAYAPTYLSSFEDDQQSLIDTTPSSLYASEAGHVTLSYPDSVDVRFTPIASEP